MVQFGLISKLDSEVLIKTIDLICKEFQDKVIYVTEVGVYAGETGSGIFEYICGDKNRNVEITGIDNGKDGEQFKYFGSYSNIITGNSNEVYNQIPNDSQHLVVQDANHSYPNAIQDFFCYMRKVKIGGFMWWHDVAPHAQGKDWQRMGSENDSDMSISVRKALTDIGLFDNKFDGWEFIMEDADLNDNCGGAAVFCRIK